MPRIAEIIAVGTEVVSGAVVNTNAQSVAQALLTLGIESAWHTAVGDDPAHLRSALETARSRADVIVTTGGLGPTLDDMTKQAVAEVFDRPLTLHPEVLETLERYFREVLRRPMPENNLRQAELPQGCTVFSNPVGTAPGCALESGGVHVLMLPGPPFEMRTMLDGHALAYLRRLSRQAVACHDIMTFGIGESDLEMLLRRRIECGGAVGIATYAQPGQVRLRLTARAPTPQEAEAIAAPAVSELTAYLGAAVYGVDVKGLPEVCMEALKGRGWTLATAESCTGGQVAQGITALPGASRVYRGGAVSYWTQVKEKVLGVPGEILERYGAVSDPCAREMAQAARRLTGAETGLSVTGAAGPEPDERGTAVGTVFIGLDTPEGTFCRHLELGQRPRDVIRRLAADHAYDMLRRYLTGLPPEPFGPGRALKPL